MLHVQHLVKRYYGIAVVNDVSFVVQPGEVIGYLGPNGSGKTTTMKMLTGLLEPTSGRILAHGRDVATDLLGYRARLGYVPEEPNMYSFLSGREYLEMVGHLRELPAASLHKKIPLLLELFGIATAADQSISSYSKGMRQKILITAALLHDPDILLFDEPDSGLDVTTTMVMRHLVQALAKQGKTILYSSHVLEIVERLCSKVIVLHRGKVVADASVEELRGVVAKKSLEDVFAQLVLREDPETTARDIASVVTSRG
jgi:ABC-2 type transport system ATP-binding protein